MLCRTDLAIDLPQVEKMMIAQKWMIQRANEIGKPIFLQSEVFDSIHKLGDPMATRKEERDSVGTR